MLEFAGIFQQQDVAAGGGAFPVIEEVTRTHFTTGSTTHNTTLPTGTVNAGDLLLIMFGSDGSATVSATGFTLSYSAANSTAVRLSVLAKVAVGTESGTTVNVATSASEIAGAICYRITGWGGSIANDIVAATGVSATSATQDHPALTSGFGAVHTMWFAIAACSGTPSISTYPSGYSYLPGTSGVAGAIGSTAAGLVVSTWRTTIAASEDPPASVMAGSTVGIANTIALRGT